MPNVPWDADLHVGRDGDSHLAVEGEEGERQEGERPVDPEFGCTGTASHHESKEHIVGSR